MIPGLFALIIISGIVGAVSFLAAPIVNTERQEASKAADFAISEHNE